ncbi:MAG: DUF3078 domain-containing protein [Cytophagales bacterium]|nr:DUF3078 domain-containing protein [Cytophagales bacterium]
MEKPKCIYYALKSKLETLKPADVDTISFFFPPKIARIEYNEFIDSLQIEQKSPDTLLLLFHPRIAILDSSNLAFQMPKPKIWNTNHRASAGANILKQEHWSKGGNNTIAVYSNYLFRANRKIKNLFWYNTIELGLGYIKDGDILKKNADFFKLTSIQSMPISKDEKWLFSSRVYLKSQFQPGYKYSEVKEKEKDENGEEIEISKTKKQRTSNFFAPADFEIGLGLSFRPKQHFSGMFSLAKGKFLIVADELLSEEGAHGVEKGETYKGEIGIGADFELIDYEIWENIKLRGTMNLFASYEKITKVDFNLASLLQFQVNKYFQVSLDTKLIYDDDILIALDDNNPDLKGPRMQVRNQLNLLFVLDWKN